MSCERTCLSKCSTKLESVFTISDDHEEAEIPDEDCYDEYLRDQMEEEDLEVCKKSELDPLTGSEQVDLKHYNCFKPTAKIINNLKNID